MGNLEVGPEMKYLMALTVVMAVFWPTTVQAQSRLQGRNGWLLPVACNTLSSDEHMHLRRGSVNAWDITCPKGSPIYPMAPAKVMYAGCNNAGGYGCWVMLEHAGGFSSIYAHMIKGSISVQSGQRVKQSDILGQVGWTGMTSFGPHVHWEIRHTSGRQRLDRYFSKVQMNVCEFCNASGEPVVARGTRSSAAAPGTLPRSYIFWSLIGAVLAIAVVLILASDSIVKAVGLPSSSAPGAVASGVLMALGIAVSITLAMLYTGQQQTSASGINPSDKWQVSYAFVRHWEGWKCTEDGAHTKGGITQGAYDRWRMRQGLGPADVCRSLTRKQAEAIYYQDYWLGSGANKLPAGLALTHFDFAVNAGVGTAQKALKVCGLDQACYHQYREAFYKSLGAFPALWECMVAACQSRPKGNTTIMNTTMILSIGIGIFLLIVGGKLITGFIALCVGAVKGEVNFADFCKRMITLTVAIGAMVFVLPFFLSWLQFFLVSQLQPIATSLAQVEQMKVQAPDLTELLTEFDGSSGFGSLEDFVPSLPQPPTLSGQAQERAPVTEQLLDTARQAGQAAAESSGGWLKPLTNSHGEIYAGGMSMPATPTPTWKPPVTAGQNAAVTASANSGGWLKPLTNAGGEIIAGDMSAVATATPANEPLGNVFQSLPDASANMSVPDPNAPSTFPTAVPNLFKPQGGPQVAQITTARRYTVQRGDTMFLIARAVYGDGNRWPAICNANTVEDCNSLPVGTVLTIP